MISEIISSLKRIEAFVKLTRPRYTAQIVAIVTILSIASYGPSLQSLLAIISALLLSVSIYFLDEAHDLTTDRIVHPKRSIPKGSVTASQAYTAGALLLLIGILLSSRLLLHQFVIFLGSSIIAMGIVFSRMGSITRAILNTFLIWALFPFSAFLDLKTSIFGLIIALPHFGGSIAKDFIHSPGDRMQNIEPPPAWSKYLASSTFFLSSIIVFLPNFLDIVTCYYVVPILFTNLSCVLLGVQILKDQYTKVYIYGAIGMVSALVAFLLGGK